MRLWHLMLAVFLAAVLLAIARDPVGRVAIVVFFTGLGEFFMGLAAVMTLFQTIGAIGYARDLVSYAKAISSTIAVLIIASVCMNLLLGLGIDLISRSVP